ncbi:hypothetical protein PTSG_02114 [Salpingoeca rosetta]|uniref:AAA+ ATPase domain-containing protein n=1 Tax=Salpingoeca rosetta (strain ATCC 50818 / BSB-021) TaxID=946362 RepID=F2U192_SALR5|nr:uncharacterized protein PTSG_02114 [Salpingoeca rosetta]EGD81394.1 hypothetical protein PTSG_02114 [Salpingoeca rosetta]|eukprot:XP_004996598.1 hypothetical protein PTSG_02114 [Salpingoeca rosetta]
MMMTEMVAVHVFAVDETLVPVPVKVARQQLENRVVQHGDVVSLPDPFLGTRRYLLALTAAPAATTAATTAAGDDGDEGDEGGKGHVVAPVAAVPKTSVVQGSIALQARTMHSVRTYHRIHPCHHSLRSLPDAVFQEHVAPLIPTRPVSPLDDAAPLVFGPVFQDLQTVLKHVLLTPWAEVGEQPSMHSVLVSGTGANYEPELTLAVCHSLGLAVVDIHEFEHLSVGSLTHAHKLACHSAPCVLWLPDLDLLFPHQKDIEAETAHEMDLLRSILSEPAHGVLVCAQTAAHRAVHEFVRDEFDLVLDVTKPSRDQRSALLTARLERGGSDAFPARVLAAVSAATNGCTMVQLETAARACRRWYAQEKAHNNGTKADGNGGGDVGDEDDDDDDDDELSALASALNAVRLHVVASRLTASAALKALVGMDDVLAALRRDFAYFLQQDGSPLRVPPPVAVTITGPPGCGKSLLCRNIGAVLGVNTISPSLAHIVKGEVGESERQIHGVFEEARRNSPCFIVFDDMASLFLRSTSGERVVSSGILSQVVAEMDAILSSNYRALRAGAECMLVTAVFVAGDSGQLAEELTAASRCFSNYTLSLPTLDQRIALLRAFLSRAHMDVPETQILDAANALDGASPAELERVVNDYVRVAVLDPALPFFLPEFRLE